MSSQGDKRNSGNVVLSLKDNASNFLKKMMGMVQRAAVEDIGVTTVWGLVLAKGRLFDAKGRTIFEVLRDSLGFGKN